MQKAAWIRIAVTVEAEDEPAHDFSKTAIEAVRSSVRLEPPDQYKNLKMTVTRIYEDATPPEDQGMSDNVNTEGSSANNARMGIAPTAAPMPTASRQDTASRVSKKSSTRGFEKKKK